VPLSAFIHVEKAIEPLSINHQGQFPAVTISFNLAPDAALGGAITAIVRAQKDLNMPAVFNVASRAPRPPFKARSPMRAS
jgi:multidrug efflux pump